ncbi:winged helix-turn-helix domain-containing protein [Vibrio sp. ZSDE26]|uniref:Winged helix-turn-helix domain-containing protein n=1 Tax=Vibrio amylolyticus TaxID=2847292 RepID=A0A9X1XML5_9VIBR|nr:winged helix-turn-helix domain-containing protein [Vibrio amylolyticus]MCK6265125.1 winged helix-turn-helix domain-containing protein [Vibrio amylolyticus]
MTKLKLEAPVYQVGDYLYSMTSGVISKNDSLSQLRSKESALLNVFIETFPEVTSREKIVEELYQNTYATDATINQLVKRLRKSLEDNNRSLIRTISKQGYLLSSPPDVVELEKQEQLDTTISRYQTEHNFEGISLEAQQQLKRFEDPVAVKELLDTTKSKQRFLGAAVTTGCVIAFVIGYAFSTLNGHRTPHLQEISSLEAFALKVTDLQAPVYVRDADTDHLSIYIADDNTMVVCNKNEELTECK